MDRKTLALIASISEILPLVHAAQKLIESHKWDSLFRQMNARIASDLHQCRVAVSKL